MSGEEIGGQLEDSHRLFIQFFIQNPVVHHNQASKLFKICTDQQEFNKESYFSFLSTINDQLSLFDLSIRQLHCHVSGERYFILANLADDQVALQWGSDLRREEIFALKEMITLIATTKKCRISTIDLLNSRLVCKYVTEKNKIEKLIDKLLQQSWFTKSSNGKICIGVRSIVELSNWLRNNFSFPSCQFCNEFVSYGECCGNECKSPAHVYCLEKYRMRSGDKKCMSCKDN